VVLTGIYVIEHPLAGRKGGAEFTRVRIIPEGDRRGPYLEPAWKPESQRSAEEMARLEGRRVHATGTLFLTPPPAPGDPPWAEALGGACLHPVESLVAADDAPTEPPPGPGGG
jgi:hypothetical protein